MASKKCASCGYIREGNDNLPDWKCPRCDALYERAPSFIANSRRSQFDFTDIPLDDGYISNEAPARNSIPKVLMTLLVGTILVVGCLYLFADRDRYVGKGEAALFVTESCGEQCEKLVLYLADRDVPFRVHTVDMAPDAMRLFEKLKGDAVPFLVMGRFRITGFDQDLIDHAINETFPKHQVDVNGVVQVSVYTSKDSRDCRETIRYLKKHDIEFTEYRIDEDSDYAADFKARGFKNVPVTIIGGKQLIGFNPLVLKEMLKNAGLL